MHPQSQIIFQIEFVEIAIIKYSNSPYINPIAKYLCSLKLQQGLISYFARI